MTYEAAYNYLITSYINGKKHDFDCLKGILTELGSPQEKISIIHVAGTNGKGSACAMLSSVLREAGYSVGMFTSPHLHRFNERFDINGEKISDEDFCKYIEIIKSVTDRSFESGETLSYFEILTLMGFVYFYDKSVDYLVLETGIGGRHDVTNVIKKPVLSIITAVGLDHMEYLGTTLDSIVYEKSGIIKKNCPTVLYFQSEQVYNTTSEVCRQKASKLYYADGLSFSVLEDGLDGTAFSAVCKYYSYKRVIIRLLGEYQINNACTVLLAVCALNELGVSITEKNVLDGLAKTSWAGRMEIVSKKPLMILDGAHNYDAAVVLSHSLENYVKDKSLTMIIGILADKQYVRMVNVLSENADTVILTKPAYAARTLEPSVLYDALEDKRKRIFLEPDYKKAVDLALALAHEDGVICCSGSLYLVGDVRGHMKEINS